MAGDGFDTVVVTLAVNAVYALPEQAEIEAIVAPKDSFIVGVLGNNFDNIIYSYEDGMWMSGGGGNDTLYASADNGTYANLSGDDGDDILYAGTGTCALRGGLGNDTLVGGAGLNDYHFGTQIGADNIDSIINFRSGEDYIVLSELIFGNVDINTTFFHMGGSSVTANQKIIYNDVDSTLMFDSYGNGDAETIQFATVAPGTTLKYTDFSTWV